MCQIWKNKEFEKMPLENVYKIIDEATKFGSKNMTIQFLGGETLLYKDLDKAIWYATKKGFRTVITTNAYLLSHKRLTQLSNAGLSNINISLDSTDEKIHNFERGMKDSYQKIMSIIVLLENNNYNIKFAINTIINSLNLHNLIDLSKFVKNNTNLNHIYFIALERPYNTNYDELWMENSPASYLWPQDKKNLNETFDNLIKETRINKKIQNTELQLEKYRSYYLNPKNIIKKYGCKFGDNILLISQNGEASLCHRREDLKNMNNINNQNIFYIWNSEKANEVRQKMLSCKQNCVQILSCGYEEE